MYNLAKLFRPIIAKPQNTLEYVEIPPCDLLKPYINCFWGSPQPVLKSKREDFIPRSTIIIPDTCMDVIVDIEHTINKINVIFCGINDTPFSVTAVNKTAITSTFAIRFHFWAVHLFADSDMKEALNAFVAIDEYFNDFKKKLKVMLIKKATITERISVTEKYLIKRLHAPRRTNSDVLNAVYFILKSKGLISVPELCARVNISQRQLERLFVEFIGISPKKITDLIRFQNVWQAMYYTHKQDFAAIAYHYNFSDQSHFTNNFKKFAGRTPLEALQYAKS